MNEGLRSKVIRIIPRSRRDGTNWAASQLLEATACPDTHVFPMHLNGRLCYVTAPTSVSVTEAMKTIQDAEDAQKVRLRRAFSDEAGQQNEQLKRPTATGLVYHSDRQALVAIEDIMAIIGVQEASKPAYKKPKKGERFYKQFDRNKYGRK